MKRLAWLAAGVAVTVLSVIILNGSDDRVQAQPPRIPQAAASRAAIIPASDCSITLIDQAVLASERPGIIAWCELEEGDPVFTGTRVASLKDGVAVAARASAEHKASNDINERYQHLAWKLAQKELEIAEEANRKLPGTVPRLEIEKLILAAQRGQLAYEQAQFEREANRKLLVESEEQLKTYTVLAPFDGIVSKVHRHRGEAVTQGAAIVEIISTARVKVEGYVEIPDADDIKKDDPVLLEVFVAGLKKRSFKGKLQLVSPTVEPLLKKIRVTAYIPNEDGILKEGLNARMTILPRGAATATRPAPRR
jgi:multidrug efflux pump subunit AcrA (membrane-fusion protein)